MTKQTERHNPSGKTPGRVAIVHEWLTTMRGGEKVLEVICEMFPEADLYVLLHVKGSVSPTIERMPIRTSFVQHLPFAGTLYRYYLPLFPTAVKMLLRERYDLVISSHHCVSKGVDAGPDALHICYCHTPMRYIWDMFDEYFAPERSGFVTRTGARLFRPYLQRRDKATAANPSFYVCNSEYVRSRIRQVYGCDAQVIHPPVDTESFAVSRRDDGYFLVAGALVPYKRVDIAVAAASVAGRKLVVAGDGPERARLERVAGPAVTFVGRVSDERLRELYANCTALVFPGEEDFGIVPVEAMASGKPVIAYGRGGVLETVEAGVSGIFFGEQSASSLADAMARFLPADYDAELIRERALRFSKAEFVARMSEFISQKLY